MNTSTVNNTAIAAALNEVEDKGSGAIQRRSWIVKSLGVGQEFESIHGGCSSDGYLGGDLENGHTAPGEARPTDRDDAVDDDFLPADNVPSASKARTRRASEGSYLTKGEVKRSSGDLRCETCGKSYKHSSCLTKHLSVFSGFPVLQLFAFAFYHRWISNYSHVGSLCSVILPVRNPENLR